MRFVFGDCELDTERYELRRAGQVVSLEPMAFRVLVYLLRHHGRAVAKSDLVKACWPETVDEQSQTYSLRNCLYKIRQAVDDAGLPQALIETVRRYGYRFTAAVTSIPTDRAAADTTLHAEADDRAPPAARTQAITLPGWRQLTVLHCELVDVAAWTALAPEDFQALIQMFYATCERIAQRFDGYIAHYDSDGCLLYFGYPTADEEAVQRAVWSGLALLEEAAQCTLPVEQLPAKTLDLRVGIHTGQVVEGTDSPVSTASTLSGAALTLAKRAQAVAPPGTVVITAETYSRVQGLFPCQALDAFLPTGTDQRLELYRVLGASEYPSRFAVATIRGLTPFVGREPELALLQHRWGQVQSGLGHMLVVSGEPGIGKSRLVQALKDHIAEQPHIRWECQSSPYAQHTALFPFTDFFRRALRWHTDDTPATQVEKLLSHLRQYHLPLGDTVPLLASLLSAPLPKSDYPPLTLSSQQQRQKTLECIITILLALAEQQPVLLIVEDIHWADPTTLELLALLLEQIPTAAICAVVSCRPTLQPHWGASSCLTQLTLGRFSQTESVAMLTHATQGKSLPPEVLEHVVSKTDGVPLFLEALLRTILDSGLLRQDADRYVLTGALPLSAIPATLQDLLMARLDQLQEAKDVVQLGAILGREFTYEVLQAVSSLDALTLQRHLAQARHVEILSQRGIPPQARYRFSHALIQDAAYQTLLPRTRQRLHGHIADVLQADFPHIGATQPELLAHHYTEAKQPMQAIAYWQQASQQAIERSAYVEARRHLTLGLDLLLTLPETPERAQQELPLRIALGQVLTATQGQAAPEAEQAYTRTLTLCQQIETTASLFPALAGLCGFYVMRCRLQTARELGLQLLGLAEQAHDADRLLQAHLSLGGIVLHCGEVVAAQAHWEQALALCMSRPQSAQPTPGSDVHVVCLSSLAWCLWLQGYPAQAQQWRREALALAERLAHPFSLMYALNYAAWLASLCRDAPGAQTYAEASIRLGTELVVPDFLAAAQLIRGWSLVFQGAGDSGLEDLRQSVAAYRATGAELHVTSILLMLAEACGYLGYTQEGLAVLDEALALGRRNGELHYEAELYRLTKASCSSLPRLMPILRR